MTYHIIRSGASGVLQQNFLAGSLDQPGFTEWWNEFYARYN